MKRIIKLFTIFSILVLFANNVNAQAIIGGAGIIKTNANPNTVTGLNDQPAGEGIMVNDTVNNTLWLYDGSLTSGSRWTQMSPFGDGFISAFAINGSNLRITRTNVGGGTTTFDVTLLSIAPVQSVIAGTGAITVTNAAGVYTVNNTDPDQSITNEGILGVTSISATSAGISSNTSTAAGISLIVSGGLNQTKSTGTNGGSITFGLDAITLSGTLTTSPTVTLGSNAQASGSFQLIGASGISIAATGTTANPIYTFSGSVASYSYYADDAAATSGGVALNALYLLDTANPYGLPRGTVRARQ